MSNKPKSSEPKYPVGSSVVCDYFELGPEKQCIVYRFYPKESVYTVYPLDNPEVMYSVAESKVSPWVEPKFRIDNVASKYNVGEVIALTHGRKIFIDTVYKDGATVFVDFTEYAADGRSQSYKDFRQQDLDSKLEAYEYHRKMELLSKDSQTYTNEQGGKQSFVSARFDCIPPVVLRLLAQCLGFGARKYGKENWQQIEQWDHLSHAMNHINEWNRGDRSEPHLVNAMARLTFALWQAVEQGQQSDTYIHPDEVK